MWPEDLTFMDFEEEKLFHDYEYFDLATWPNHLPNYGCFHMGEAQYICTRRNGHAGRHAATNAKGDFILSWENTYTLLKVAAWNLGA